MKERDHCLALPGTHVLFANQVSHHTSNVKIATTRSPALTSGRNARASLCRAHPRSVFGVHCVQGGAMGHKVHRCTGNANRHGGGPNISGIYARHGCDREQRAAESLKEWQGCLCVRGVSVEKWAGS